MAVNCEGGKKITKTEAHEYMKSYQTFLDNVAQGKVIGALNLAAQPKYLKVSRELIEEILADETCGGLGIALALTEKGGGPQFTLVVGPLGSDCEIEITDFKVVEDLGQGDLYDPKEALTGDKFNKFLNSLL